MLLVCKLIKKLLFGSFGDIKPPYSGRVYNKVVPETEGLCRWKLFSIQPASALKLWRVNKQQQSDFGFVDRYHQPKCRSLEKDIHPSQNFWTEQRLATRAVSSIRNLLNWSLWETTDAIPASFMIFLFQSRHLKNGEGGPVLPHCLMFERLFD